MKRIVHITSSRELTSGQRQQLHSEHQAALMLQTASWTTLAYHTNEPKLSFEKRIPLFFRPILLRNLYIWLKILSYQNDYDLVLLRHMTFDPFSIVFSPFVKNRISVHHAKEIEELKLVSSGWKGRLASMLEVIAGKILIKNSVAIIGVTEEIGRYQNTRRRLNKIVFSYPNGIDLQSIPLAQDCREKENINIAFICGTFSEWHGLDLLIKSVKEYTKEDLNFKIHLIGKLNNSYINSIKDKECFINHGFLAKKEYLDIVSKCDIALGSLAMFRQNLDEGATLKVREMLALGIPVYSTHIDTSLQDNSIFYLNDKVLDIENLVNYGLEMKKYSRQQVRNDTARFIDKTSILQSLIIDINNSLF